MLHAAILAGLAWLFGSIAGYAQVTGSATGTATLNLRDGLTIVADQDLRFGDIVPMNGGRVTIDPSTGATTSTGTVILLGSHQAGSFEVVGEANRGYTITLPAGKIELVNGGNTITVDKFTSDPPGGGTLGAAGTQTVTVGGRAKISNGQPVGLYSGTYSVTVAYQ